MGPPDRRRARPLRGRRGGRRRDHGRAAGVSAGPERSGQVPAPPAARAGCGRPGARDPSSPRHARTGARAYRRPRALARGDRRRHAGSFRDSRAIAERGAARAAFERGMGASAAPGRIRRARLRAPQAEARRAAALRQHDPGPRGDRASTGRIRGRRVPRHRAPCDRGRGPGRGRGARGWTHPARASERRRPRCRATSARRLPRLQGSDRARPLHADRRGWRQG